MPIYLTSSTYGLLTTLDHPSPPTPPSPPPPPPPLPPSFPSPYHTYNLFRRDFLNESVSRLGIHTRAVEELQAASWGDLEDKIVQWTSATAVAVRVLFPCERRLCDLIFAILGRVADLALAESCCGAAIQLRCRCRRQSQARAAFPRRRHVAPQLHISPPSLPTQVLLYQPLPRLHQRHRRRCPCAFVPICCTFVAGGSSTSYKVRASGVGCNAYWSSVNLNTAATPVSQWGQRAGVELQWASPLKQLCRTQANCEDGSNTTCAADTASGGEDPRGRGARKAAGRPLEGTLRRRAVRRLWRGTVPAMLPM